MAALTPAIKVFEKLYAPGQETVTFSSVSSGDTYQSQTLSKVDAVQFTMASPIVTTSGVPYYTVSGRVVTFFGTGLSSKAMTATLYGN